MNPASSSLLSRSPVSAFRAREQHQHFEGFQELILHRPPRPKQPVTRTPLGRLRKVNGSLRKATEGKKSSPDNSPTPARCTMQEAIGFHCVRSGLAA